MLVFDRNSKNWKTPFFIIWAGQAFSLLGSNLVNFALVWWMTESTGSATVLATATTLIFLPRILLGPFVGALVDRWDRRKVMIVADGLIAGLTILLSILFYLDIVQIWHVYVLIFLRSLGGTFHFPAMQASTTLMVPEKQLSRIAGLNQMLDGGVSVAGPPLGALLLTLIPIYGVLMVDVVTAAIAIIPLLFILIPQPDNIDKTELVSPKSILLDVRDSFRWLKSWPGLTIILLVSILMNFVFTPVFSFLPLLVTDHFAGGAWELSNFEALMGIGMIAGGLLMSIWGGFRKKVFTIIAGIIGDGIGTLLLGFAPSHAIGMALIGLFISGFMNTFANASAFSLLQSMVPAELQGRLIAILMSVSTVMSPLGLLVATPLVEHLGLNFWYIFAGFFSLAMGVVCFFIPSLYHLEEKRTSSNIMGIASSEAQ